VSDPNQLAGGLDPNPQTQTRPFDHAPGPVTHPHLTHIRRLYQTAQLGLGSRLESGELAETLVDLVGGCLNPSHSIEHTF
jgi:hypothetical protein